MVNFWIIVAYTSKLTIEVVEDDSHSLPLEVVDEFVDGPLEAGLQLEGRVQLTDASLECEVRYFECTGIALDDCWNGNLSGPTEDRGHTLIRYLAHCSKHIHYKLLYLKLL